jgi:hypothetical protein
MQNKKAKPEVSIQPIKRNPIKSGPIIKIPTQPKPEVSTQPIKNRKPTQPAPKVPNRKFK